MKTSINLEYSKMVRNRILNFKEKDKLRPKNKKLVLKFVENAIREGIGEKRIVKYFGQFKNLDKWFSKDFDKVERKDVERVIEIIATSEYEEWTKWSYRVIIKKFWKWLKGKNEEYPKEVKWIKARQGKRNRKKRKDMITREDLKKLIESSTSDRNRCIIALLYESGVRVGELLGLKIKDIEFDSDPVKIFVEATKTNTIRRIPIVESVPYITRWLQSHPDKRPESPLFVNYVKYTGKPMSTHCVHKVMNRLREKLNNGKNLYPHLFRHSRATELANYLTEAQMNKFFGWETGSNMSSEYVHLSGRDIDNAIMTIYGKESKQESIQEKLTPKPCPRCSTTTIPTDKVCLNCGLPLTPESLLNADNFRSKIYDMVERIIESKLNERLEKAGIKAS